MGSFQNELCPYGYISLEVINNVFKISSKKYQALKHILDFDFPTQAIWKITEKYLCDWKKLFQAPLHYLNHSLKNASIDFHCFPGLGSEY